MAGAFPTSQSTKLLPEQLLALWHSKSVPIAEQQNTKPSLRAVKHFCCG